jgi:hypothetical protein
MTLRILLVTTSAKRRTFCVDMFKNNKDVPWGIAGHLTDNLGSGDLFREGCAARNFDFKQLLDSDVNSREVTELAIWGSRSSRQGD